MAQVTAFGPKNKRGVCSVCGAAAWDGRATKCTEHEPKKDKIRRVKGDDLTDPSTLGSPPADGDTAIRVDRPTPAPPPKPTKDEKEQRAVVLERSILNDLNPVMVQGFAMICKPIPPENFYTLDGEKTVPTDLGKAVMFAEWEAKALGKAAAELEKSPVGAMATAAVGPVLPVVFAVAGLGVVAMHGYKVMQLRDHLLTQYGLQMQREAANAPTEAGPAPTNGDTPPNIAGIRTDGKPGTVHAPYRPEDLAG